MNTDLEVPRERERRKGALVAGIVIAVAVLVLSAAALVTLSSSSRQGVTSVGLRTAVAANGGNANNAEVTPQASTSKPVLHSTGNVVGLVTEQWVDPASGTRRLVIHDRDGSVCNESGWDAASGEVWAVDHRARIVLRKSASSPVAGVAGRLESEYPAFEEKLASGAAVAEGYETYNGVNALRVRQFNPGGMVQTTWLDPQARRVLGAETGGVRVSTEYLEGDAAARAPVSMPDVSGYQRVDSMPMPGVAQFGI